jgi:hypothetical protein
VGKSGGKIMLALGIVVNATLVIMLLISGVWVQWTCLWWIVLMGLALAGGILIRRGWKLYRQG